MLERREIVVSWKPMAVNCLLPHRHDHLNPGRCVPNPCGCGQPAIYGFARTWWCSSCYLKGVRIVRQEA